MKSLAQSPFCRCGAARPQFRPKGLSVMKNHAPSEFKNFVINDQLLEAIVSAHYLVLQMRMLVSSDDFNGKVETELMADALSQWAQFAEAKWSDA